VSYINQIRASKDQECQLSLSEAERAQVPENPVGLIELTGQFNMRAAERTMKRLVSIFMAATIALGASHVALANSTIGMGLITQDTNARPDETRFEKLAHRFLQRRAKNKEEFKRILEQTYGPEYDLKVGQYLRRKMAHGDFSWTPSVQLVTAEILNGRLGAYRADTNTIYLSEQVSNQHQAVLVYLEELGHHIDTLLKASDTEGDEGALFRTNMVGEKLPPYVIAEIYQRDDQGVIAVEGRAITVEFFSFNPIDWVKDGAKWTWGGIKSASGWVWKGAKTAGKAISKAASTAWDGAEVLGGWIAEGAEWAADRYVDMCRRSFVYTYQQTQNMVNTLVTYGYGSYEGVKIMGQGLAEIAKGNLVDGTAALYVGLAKLSVEVPLDTLSSEAIEAIGALQTLLFLEPEGRFLNDREKAFLGTVFYNPWWLNVIRVKEGFAGIWSINPRPFTVETTIYLKKWPYSEDLMVHETVHVWQFMNGGGDYKIDSLHAQLQGDAYEWESAVDSGKSWGSLNAEQQARFIQDAYLSGCYAFSGTCIINGMDRTGFFPDADYNLINGIGAP
jgi:mersacidin/lichenicidin family type 2 lantibiotic